MKTQRCAYMLSRPVFFIWISIKIDGDSKFRLSFPIPIYILFMYADIIGDIACIWRIFSGKKAKNSHKRHNLESPKENFMERLKNPTPETLSSVAKIIRRLLFSICFQCGASDLLDIDVVSDDERVRIKCLLR